jgi:hypothetical protein
MFLQIFRKGGIFLQFAYMWESYKKICSLSDGLIPKFNHGSPVRAHTAWGVNESSDYFLFGGCCIDLGYFKEWVL